MKKLAIAACVLACGITASQAVILIPAGSGTFLAPGETDTFNLYVTSTPSVIQQVTITLTAAAGQTGTVVSNTNAGPAAFTGTLTSNYGTTISTPALSPFTLTAGTISLSAAQNSGTLAPGAQFGFNVSDTDTLTVVFTGVAAQGFASAVAGTGNITASTLSSLFGVTVNPSTASILTDGGVLTTNYTWNMVYTVPEPSAALLGGLGFLGLLRRRR